METGMADFAHRAALSSEPLALDSIEEYDLYCHYVAGLVGEGLSRLFSVTGKESPSLAHQLELSNSLGTFLQKTNIIRDFREDAEDRRFFWPREVWGAAEYGPDGRTPATDIFQLLREPQRAQWAQSGMILDALRHACDALDYLRLLKNQSVFTFAAIPAMMAIATLDLCFMNPEMFKRNIKIRKAKAAEVRALIFFGFSLCLTPRLLAHHALNKPTRVRAHLQKLCTIDSRQGLTLRPKLSPHLGRMCQNRALGRAQLPLLCPHLLFFIRIHRPLF
jgi:farnesyl-diphosphate farnesyltransferase